MGKTSYISTHGMIWGEINDSGVMRSYGHDALGSVVETYTGSGTLENTYRYKPYGGLLAKTGTAADPYFLYNGGSGYRTTGLANSDYYVRRRHFSSASAHWTTLDPIWPNARPYAYCSGAPTVLIDPSGLGGVLAPGPIPGPPPPPGPQQTGIMVAFSGYINNTPPDDYGKYVDLTYGGVLSSGIGLFSGTDRQAFQNAPNRFQTQYSITSTRIGINPVAEITSVGMTNVYTPDPTQPDGKIRVFSHQGYVATPLVPDVNYMKPCVISAIHTHKKICAALFPSWDPLCIKADVHIGFKVTGPNEITIKMFGTITQFPSFDATVSLNGDAPMAWWNKDDLGANFPHPFFGLAYKRPFGPTYFVVPNVQVPTCGSPGPTSSTQAGLA